MKSIMTVNRVKQPNRLLKSCWLSSHSELNKLTQRDVSRRHNDKWKQYSMCFKIRYQTCLISTGCNHNLKLKSVAIIHYTQTSQIMQICFDFLALTLPDCNSGMHNIMFIINMSGGFWMAVNDCIVPQLEKSFKEPTFKSLSYAGL